MLYGASRALYDAFNKAAKRAPVGTPQGGGVEPVMSGIAPDSNQTLQRHRNTKKNKSEVHKTKLIQHRTGSDPPGPPRAPGGCDLGGCCVNVVWFCISDLYCLFLGTLHISIPPTAFAIGDLNLLKYTASGLAGPECTLELLVKSHV
jgi:hypothetical protein